MIFETLDFKWTLSCCLEVKEGSAPWSLPQRTHPRGQCAAKRASNTKSGITRLRSNTERTSWQWFPERLYLQCLHVSRHGGAKQASPNYGPRAGCGPPYASIRPANAINKCKKNKINKEFKFDVQDGGSTYLWNVGRQLFYTALHPRRQFWTSYSPPWELEISQI
jgi:hypothetical protein